MGEFLKSVVRGKQEKPFRVLLYGREGVGKTTWASRAPRPLFIGQRGEADELDVDRPDKKIERWDQVLDVVDELRNEEHPFQSIVFDTADWLEPIIFRHVCDTPSDGKPRKNIEDFGYGKGYKSALDDWRQLFSKLEDLEDRRGMNVIILAHAQVKTFNNPDGDNYDLFDLKLSKEASGLLKEWTKAVLFAVFETFTKKANKNDPKAKAYGEGARLVHTQPRPAWHAKSRYPLPATMALSWDDFAAYARNRAPDKPDLRDQIGQLLKDADDVARTQGEAALGRCGDDPQKLAMLAEWLRGRVSVAAAE